MEAIACRVWLSDSGKDRSYSSIAHRGEHLLVKHLSDPLALSLGPNINTDLGRESVRLSRLPRAASGEAHDLSVILGDEPWIFGLGGIEGALCLFESGGCLAEVCEVFLNLAILDF
jgi:hypothetical protein